MKRIFITFLILQLCYSINGQLGGPRLTLDNDTIIIGETVNLTLYIDRLPANIDQPLTLNLSEIENLAYEQDTNFFEQNGDFEILNNPLSQYTNEDNIITFPLNKIKNEKLPWTVNLKLGAYSVGVFYINNPYFGSQVDTLKDRMGSYIFVMPPSEFGQDSTKLINNIRPIIEVESNWKDYLVYIYGALGLFLLLLIGYYLRKYLNIPKVLVEEEAIVIPEQAIEIIPPHIIALKELNKLQSEKIWQDGHVKQYQSQLTNTIRTYLEGRYNIKALELTTSEIAKELDQHGFTAERLQSLREILTVADLVKFAKAKPSEDIHQKFLDSAFEFVNKTKQISNGE